MAQHHDFGKAGEQMAVQWLINRQFQPLFRNWKWGRYEIDIIASRNGVLHFIEVKSRRDNCFGNPEDWVDRKKWNHISKAAVGFQDCYPEWTVFQYDILAILVPPNNQTEFFFIEDVYWW